MSDETSGTGSAPDVEAGGEQRTSVMRWIAQYVFWVIVLFSVATATWWSASGGAAFRYAGF